MTDYLDYTVDFDDPDTVSVIDEVSFWSSRFGALLFEHLALEEGITALDLGCAAGFPLFELAHAHGGTSQFIGVDIWTQALERAAAKHRFHRLGNVALLNADGAHLPLWNASIDLVVSNVSINNFADPQAVLSECARVIKPGGRIALTTNPKGHMWEFYAVFHETLLEHGDPAYLEKLRVNENHRLSRRAISNLLLDASFNVSRVIEDSFQLRYLNGSAFFRHFLTRVGFVPGWRAVVDKADEQAIFEMIEQKLNDRARADGELRMTVPMLYIEGTRA